MSHASLRCLFLLLYGLPALVAAQEQSYEIVNSRIESVTVYVDRARVRREARLQLKKGIQTYAFSKLPGWADEESIRLALEPVAAARIADVRVQREYLARPDDAELRKAEAAVQEIADKVRELDDELNVLSAKKSHVANIRAFSLEKLPRDTVLKDTPPEKYGKVVDFIAGSLRKIAAERREIEKKRREADPELKARKKRLAELQQRTQLEQCTVLVTVECAAARDASVTLTYMLPGATWQPAHELRVDGKRPNSVELISYAVVSQTTGEDWDGAEISFSTQSPTESIRIPELDALLLGRGRSLAQVTGGMSESFQTAQRKYKGQNALWYRYNNPDQSANDFLENRAYQENIQDQQSVVFETLQKRGTTAHFRTDAKPVVRSDGGAARVTIGRVLLESEQEIVAAPETSLNAARIMKMNNTGNQPLLPGKVGLYKDASFLGMTDLDFVAVGETFTSFFGVADRIKLSRVLDQRRSSFVRGKRTRMKTAFRVSVENLSDRQETVRLGDRVPVSEDREVTVSRVRVEPEGEPDAKGLIQWNLSLAPKEKREFTIEYTLEYPSDLMQRGKASRSISAEASDLYEQIQDLEVMMH